MPWLGWHCLAVCHLVSDGAPLLIPPPNSLPQGHVVMRYHCPLKEQRRHRIFEKCFDVAATSPYAAPVRQWVFVGYDNGARIAAGGEEGAEEGGGLGALWTAPAA